MKNKKTVLAISGSTRADSTNSKLITAFADLAPELKIDIYEGLDDLPHFNPDLDGENVSEKVTDFRNRIRSSDGILICTPEYAMGVPGTLKNAIDWTVSSADFSQKPVALITASTSGEKAHDSLLETLKVIEAEVADSTQLLISYARSKISKDGKITDEKTLADVSELISLFVKMVENRK